ncbi:MAG: phage portal protein [Oscillospiraceae bacterium]
MALFRKKEKRAESDLTEADVNLLKALIGGISDIDKTSAMEIPAVQACINLISDIISTLPIKLYEEKDGEVNELTDDPRVLLLNGDTGDTLNGTQLKKLWVLDYFLGKGSYTYIDRDIYSRVKGLYYVDESRVCIIPNTNAIFKDYTVSVDGRGYPRSDFLKILRKSKGKGVGTSIISESKTILLVAYNTMKFENAVVKKGGNKRGFLTSQKQQTVGSMKRIKEAWKKMFSNSQDAEDNVCVLNEGMDFKEASETSLEMQLNENKKTNSDEICRLFCVPPQIFSESAEGAKNALISNCIMPTLNTIEAALDTDLLLESEKGTIYFAFDTRELTRGNIIQRYQAYEIGLHNGFLQLPDVREQEDLPPIDFPYIKLGLNDVFYNPQTKVIYTPNTNQTAVMGENTANVMGEITENILPSENRGGIIEERGNPNHAKDGKFTFGKVRMSDFERKHISSYIFTNFPELAKDSTHAKEIGDYFYAFTVKEPGTYRFIVKKKITLKSKEFIDEMRKMFNECE